MASTKYLLFPRLGVVNGPQVSMCNTAVFSDATMSFLLGWLVRQILPITQSSHLFDGDTFIWMPVTAPFFMIYFTALTEQ